MLVTARNSDCGVEPQDKIRHSCYSGGELEILIIREKQGRSVEQIVVHWPMTYRLAY